VWRVRTRHKFSQIQFFKQPAMYRHGFTISPRLFARGLPEFRVPLKSEGAGNAGRAMHPQPRVPKEKSTQA
jgi:hypothetical protein